VRAQSTSTSSMKGAILTPLGYGVAEKEALQVAPTREQVHGRVPGHDGRAEDRAEVGRFARVHRARSLEDQGLGRARDRVEGRGSGLQVTRSLLRLQPAQE